MSDLNHPDLEKLSMLDEHGGRMWIYAAEVKGFFRKHRDWTQVVLILIFLALPWIKIGGYPAVLLNIAERKFAIFGITFFAHDGPLIFFLLLGAVFSLAFATAVWGRVWCGWACPQTVFIDGVFRKIERLTEGNHLQRRALDNSPPSANKFFRKSSKWVLFFLASSVIAHSFIAYFVGAENLAVWTTKSPSEHMVPFLFASIITAIIAFDFGWFREQFCIIACPYGKFQSVLYDRRTSTIMYDSARGEPRRGLNSENQGDCINCSKCIQVCPTGIDIRNGIQLECIGCTACADACDEIMDKVKKPRGLIRYMNTFGRNAQIFRTRTVIYIGIILIAIAGLSYNIGTRKDIRVQILRGKENPYTETISSDGKAVVINHLRLHILNQSFEDKSVSLSSPPEWSQMGLELKTPENPILIKSGEFKMIHFFVTSPKEILKLGKFNTFIFVNDQKLEARLVGPFQ